MIKWLTLQINMKYNVYSYKNTVAGGNKMRFVEDFTRDEYIDWLMAYKDYSYEDAVKMADIMGY